MLDTATPERKSLKSDKGGGIRRFFAACTATALVLLTGLDARAMELSFEDALDLAHRHAVELQSLAAEEAVAEAGHTRSAQVFLPRLTADATWLRADSSFINDITLPTLTLPPRLVSRDFGPVEGTFTALQVVQPLVNVDGWKVRKQAGLGVETRRLAREWGAEMVRLETARRYFAVAVGEYAVSAGVMAVEAARQAHESARRAYEEGFVARLDVLRANTEYETSRARLMEARGDLHEARTDLATFLGLPSREDLILTSDLPRPQPPTEVFPAAPRKDLLAMETRVEAAAAGLERAGARWLPRVNFLARRQWFDSSKPIDTDSDSWVVAVNLQWTLFAGMDRQGDIAEERARTSLSRIELSQARREATREQEIASSAWHVGWSAWQASNLALESASTAANLARRQYEEGLGNMTDLLAAQAILHQTRLEHVRHQYRALVASMSAYLSHGRDPLLALSGERP
ncbi:Outer membrane protein TolC [Desulfonatronum thiosulfatophilum]|uniref:Outer membrane protein TolC n=2 Tax=Desulfonatronum thiosulfatophilum TaxID=617002 RepID=A0A1G6E4J1_9BACT|nr:Outer membrane protein TolC [Desulfonatronum thiosulfatophilum]